MIPGNIDPRRPDKVQRYKPLAAGNAGAPGDDLTPDYMNILGPDSTTGNVQADVKVNETKKHMEVLPPSNPQQLNVLVGEDALKSKPELLHPANTTSNVIPTSPQYGVAIIPTTTTNDIANEANTLATDTVTESNAKSLEPENKDMHSTPSKNDRFKVVKIASSEPFRRGRWKCMDYVDQTPPTTMQPTKTATQPNAGSVQMPSGNVYMQTQSLPPHQIQQLLLQSALAATQLYQGNMQSQVVPQAQYFYPGVQGQGNIPTQIINQPVVTATTVQPQFINSTQQQYFQPAIIPQNYQNLQFIQPAYQNQNNSAFVPATQNMQSFQQAQSYTGQPTVTQQNVVQPQVPTISASQPQPIVNGFPYSPRNLTEQQITANNLPTQVTKNVMVTSNPPVVPQVAPQVGQNQVVQNQNPSVSSLPNQQESQNSISQTVPIQSQQLLEQHNLSYQQGSQPTNPGIQNSPVQNVVVLQPCDQTNNVYTNPQFVASVHSLPIIEQNDTQVSDDTTETPSETTNGNSDDPAKTNPVVNAIDNKIEQAMDLVKSHLMYTVREEVEVLKEKIAELMERIQQLESENNFLRSQLPKHNPNSNGTSDPSTQQ